MRYTLRFLIASICLCAGVALADDREILPGITTERMIQGAPYELAGNRVVFTNWYYIQPGDLDWRDATGKSVYVDGNSDLYEAQHIGINAPHGIRIRAEIPTVQGPMDLPYRCILRDGAVYKGWTSTEYMESTDGVHWEKKAMLAFDSLIHDGIWHVFLDPVSTPEERYKSVWVGTITRAEFDAFRKARPDGWEPRALLHAGEKDEVTCVRGSYSADGITWNTYPDPLVVEYCDTLNTCYYDPALRKYVLYTRYWDVGPQSQKVPVDIRNSWTGIGRRAVGRSESADFRKFTPSEPVLDATSEMLPSETLYTNCHTTVPGAPDQQLMFPTVWNASIDDTTRIKMASSHDGKFWEWTPDGDLLRTEKFGAWNGGCIWALPELIELPNGDWALPYLAHNVPHKYPRGKRVGGSGYAVWPNGRMVALEAEDRGAFTMIPFVAPGNVLKINAVTQRAGWIKVEVMGIDGHGMDDCAPIVGDQPWRPVTWKGGADLGVAPGKPVTLRIEMYLAKLYGLEFARSDG